MNVLFQPHSDDCCLFSCFNAIRYRPQVITVLSSVKQLAQGIEQTTRLTEDICAMGCLGLELAQWPEPDVNPDWDAVEAMMRELHVSGDEVVLAPAVEEGGHDQHSMVGQLADQVFEDRVIHYMTYVRGHGRSTGHQVEFDPEWVPMKYRALACYQSQITEPSTRPWFIDDVIREYVFA